MVDNTTGDAHDDGDDVNIPVTPEHLTADPTPADPSATDEPADVDGGAQDPDAPDQHPFTEADAAAWNATPVDGPVDSDFDHDGRGTDDQEAAYGIRAAAYQGTNHGEHDA